MGDLTDKLERAARGTVRALGFASPEPQRTAPILLLGIVKAGDAGQSTIAKKAGLDGLVFIPSEKAPKASIAKSVKSAESVTAGVWLEKASASLPDGCDFEIFSSIQTPLSALNGEDRTLFMQVAAEMDDSLLRTIDLLPVDGFVVSIADAATLDVGQLMRLARVRSATGRYLFVQLAQIPSKDEAEQLRDAGVSAIVLNVSDHTAKSLKECRELMLQIPTQPVERGPRDHGNVRLPHVAGFNPSEPAPQAPDDDDWDED